MIVSLAEYDKYFKDGEDGKIVVIKETPQNIKNKLKRINKEFKKSHEEDMFIFEGEE